METSHNPRAQKVVKYKELDYTPLSKLPKKLNLVGFLKIPEGRKQTLVLLMVMILLMPATVIVILLEDAKLPTPTFFIATSALYLFLFFVMLYASKADLLMKLKRNAFKDFRKMNGLSMVDANITSSNTAIIYRLITHHRKHHGFAIKGDPVPIAIYHYSGSRKKGAIGTAANTALSFFDKRREKFIETEHFDSFGFTVIQCKLDTRVPNIIYDAHKNNSGRLLGQADVQDWLSKKQKYEFSGDFNKYFDVYIPPNYERDALYFTTPNIMAAMIDHGSDFDFEIVDDQLYLFKPYHVDFNDLTVKQLVETARYFGKLFEKATRLYEDSRAADSNTVHADGQRLRQTITPDIV